VPMHITSEDRHKDFHYEAMLMKTVKQVQLIKPSVTENKLMTAFKISNNMFYLQTPAKIYSFIVLVLQSIVI
jgi:hypothetical protein